VLAAAEAIATDVIHHIDTMYPAIWQGVPQMARRSVRNTVINGVTHLLQHWPPPEEEDSRC